MTSRFRHVALIGKYQASGARAQADCDLGLVVGGDGTMLGIGRQLAAYGVPLVGINQGRLGFITDIPLDTYRHVWHPCCAANTKRTAAA
jgi:NAD+ kinase